MSSGKMLRLTLLGFAFIIVAVGILFAMRQTRGSKTEIELPSPAAPVVADAEVILNNIDMLTVSADNIREIVASLNRPEAYSRNIVVESFWDGGNAAYNFDVSVKDGVTALRTTYGGKTKNIIITGDYTYVWYVGDSVPARIKNSNDNVRDEWQMLVTHEDIVGLERSQVLSAELINDENGSGIYVRYVSSPFSYVTEVRVSIDLGLITSAEQYDGETLIYKMVPGACSLEVPGDTRFVLPDGQSVFK